MILPQGCSELLYIMAKKNCSHVFPNFDARFRYPGKINQINLFKKTDTVHPKTDTFLSVSAFKEMHGWPPESSGFSFPIVFKFDWGGEGDLVYQIFSVSELNRLLVQAGEFEKTGQSGFLIQENILSSGRTLRVNVIGQQLFSYWRVCDTRNGFQANLSKGASIDYGSYPELQESAKKSVSLFCEKTGINLAGFDILFSFDAPGRPEPTPFFLEINFFFGRRGVGGSEKFYDMLVQEINEWLNRLGVSVNT